jgi:hypothetical protein
MAGCSYKLMKSRTYKLVMIVRKSPRTNQFGPAAAARDEPNKLVSEDVVVTWYITLYYFEILRPVKLMYR